MKPNEWSGGLKKRASNDCYGEIDGSPHNHSHLYGHACSFWLQRFVNHSHVLVGQAASNIPQPFKTNTIISPFDFKTTFFIPE